MQPETLKILKSIRDNIHRRELWFILTILRGPDFNKLTTETDAYSASEIKDATTSVARYRIFGNCDVDFDCEPDNEENLKVRIWLYENFPLYHFVEHALIAFEYLGLKWDGVNSSETLNYETTT